MDESYLQSGDGSSQISAKINATDDYYAYYAPYALVNGKLHIFGGYNDNGGYKVVFLFNLNKKYHLDRAIRWLLFERASGETQGRTRIWSRGSDDWKRQKR